MYGLACVGGRDYGIVESKGTQGSPGSEWPARTDYVVTQPRRMPGTDGTVLDGLLLHRRPEFVLPRRLEFVLLAAAAHVVHLGRVRVAGRPLGRQARADLGHAHVGLLERETLELGHKEVGKGQTQAAEAAPDPEDVGSQVGLLDADQVGGNDCEGSMSVGFGHNGKPAGRRG